MRTIKTTKGQSYKICDCHYDMTKGWKWTAFTGGRDKRYYMVRRELIDGRQKTILLHRWVMGMPEGMIVDHINGNGLDNRCKNLRVCTQSQNNANQKGAKHNSKSGHKGVYWHKAAQKWCAEVVFDYKKHYLGVYKNKLDAVEAYNKKAKELYGDFFRES